MFVKFKSVFNFSDEFFCYSKFKNESDKKYEMSLLRKISSSNRLLIRNGFPSIGAYYSRRSKLEEFESFFKVVSAKPKIKGLSVSVLMLHNIFFYRFVSCKNSFRSGEPKFSRRWTKLGNIQSERQSILPTEFGWSRVAKRKVNNLDESQFRPFNRF